MSKPAIPRVPALIAAILLCEAAGGIGALAVNSSLNTWYRELRKPAFNPPGSAFGPVWTLLYASMGVAAYIASTNGTDQRARRTAQGLFAAQLTLNAGWSLIFFGRREPRNAFLEIILLWMAIVLTTVAFFRISRLAGALLLPYLAWTTFAAVLNFSIWRLNPEASR
jgi:benzodiazapine receptor